MGIGATAFAQDTEEPELTPEISLLPMRGDTVGKNVTVKLTVSTGLVNDEGISFPAEMMYKTVVYYTTDGTTEPSEEAYEDQTDKENGTIKMVENIWDDEEEEYIVDENSMAYISLTFDREVHFMARAYYTMETNLGSVPAKTALYDRELKIKSEVNPAFLAGGAEAASGKVFTVNFLASCATASGSRSTLPRSWWMETTLRPLSLTNRGQSSLPPLPTGIPAALVMSRTIIPLGWIMNPHNSIPL